MDAKISEWILSCAARVRLESQEYSKSDLRIRRVRRLLPAFFSKEKAVEMPSALTLTLTVSSGFNESAHKFDCMDKSGQVSGTMIFAVGPRVDALGRPLG